MSKALLLVTILAVPSATYGDSAEKTNANTASQLAATLDSSKGNPSRKPKLDDVKPTAAKTPEARATGNRRVAEPPQLAPAPIRRNKIEPIANVNNVRKVEAKGARSAFQPVSNGANKMRGARVGRSRRVPLATFDPGQLRGGTKAGTQADDIARSWKSNLAWDAITIDSYATMKGRSEADTQKLALRDAERVRTYLVRRGIPSEYVLVVGHAEPNAPGANVEVSVVTCDDVTITCRKPATAK